MQSKKRKATSKEKPAKRKATSKEKQPKESSPPAPFEDSSIANQFEITSDELDVGSLTAHWILDDGGAWFVGKVTRQCKPWWSDTHFEDGKLWMRTQPSDRGVCWHVVRKRE